MSKYFPEWKWVEAIAGKFSYLESEKKRQERVMNDIDKYFAEQCGVTGKGLVPSGFTIEDPTCRQRVREKYKLTTRYDGGRWECETCEGAGYRQGKTIDEAEIACCEAIYEARGE